MLKDSDRRMDSKEEFTKKALLQTRFLLDFSCNRNSMVDIIIPTQVVENTNLIDFLYQIYVQQNQQNFINEQKSMIKNLEWHITNLTKEKEKNEEKLSTLTTKLKHILEQEEQIKAIKEMKLNEK